MFIFISYLLLDKNTNKQKIIELEIYLCVQDRTFSRSGVKKGYQFFPHLAGKPLDMGFTLDQGLNICSGSLVKNYVYKRVYSDYTRHFNTI